MQIIIWTSTFYFGMGSCKKFLIFPVYFIAAINPDETINALVYYRSLSQWHHCTYQKVRSQVLPTWKSPGRKGWPQALRARQWPVSFKSSLFSLHLTQCLCRRERMVRPMSPSFCPSNPSFWSFSLSRVVVILALACKQNLTNVLK